MNTQEYTLPIMESFYSIQGEGYHSGKPAWFLRVGGCDVGCHWCDVKESWDAGLHENNTLSQIMEQQSVSDCKLAVITGGEPAMYDLEPLTAELISKGIKTHIETSGAYALTGIWHWICFSPKKFKAPVEAIYDVANELKVVVFNRHDLQWAESHANKVSRDCVLYLQPEWSKRDEVMPMIVDYVKQNPQWRISIQTHKYLNVP